MGIVPVAVQLGISPQGSHADEGAAIIYAAG